MLNDVDQLVVPSLDFLFYFETRRVSRLRWLLRLCLTECVQFVKSGFVSVSLLVCAALCVSCLVLYFSDTLSSSCHSRLIFYFDTLLESFCFLVIIVLSPTVIYSLRKALFSSPTVIFIPPFAHCFQNIVT